LRQAEAARTSAESELRRRSRAGFTVRSRDELVVEAAERREQEVAAGAATFSICLVASVAAPTRAALRRAGDELVAAVRRARCDAHGGLGEQARLWRLCVPLAAAPPEAPHVLGTSSARSVFPAQVELAGAGGGVLLGRDVLSGGAFSFDPWAAYDAGVVTSPNVAVLGQVGRGKSTIVKALLGRSVGVFGRRAWVLDPKGEYGPLAARLGLPVVALRPGGTVYVNPLDAAPGLPPDETARQRSALLEALAGSELARPLTVRERAALYEAVRRLPARPVLGDVVDLLLDPPPEMATELASTPPALAEKVHEAALALRELVAGRLAGMFDRATNVQLGDRGGVIDLTAAYQDPATLGPILAASMAWILASLRSGEPTYLVVDEAWAVLGAAADFLRASAKLARSLGVALVLVLHRLSDLAAAGDDGAAVAKRAAGLFQDVETRFLFAQPPAEAGLLAAALDLSDREVELLPDLGRGRCLAVVGGEHRLVDVVLTPGEAATTDTDAAMRRALEGGPKVRPGHPPDESFEEGSTE
jgi:energy-coupling factor transporter ATP-binding protein EcfA2